MKARNRLQDRHTLEEIFTPAGLALIRAARESDRDAPVTLTFAWPALEKKPVCTCGHVEHGRSRQARFRAAEREARRHVHGFTRDVAALLDRPPGCDCTLCINTQELREAALRLAASYTAHAAVAPTPTLARVYRKRGRFYEGAADGIHDPHPRGGA